jgi:hypothetical protein
MEREEIIKISRLLRRETLSLASALGELRRENSARATSIHARGLRARKAYVTCSAFVFLGFFF